MCGITGIFNLIGAQPIQEKDLRQMLALIRHRGPDGFGVYLDDEIGLGSARLSIIDLSGGFQPIANEDGSLWIIFNGEIFNYVEIRPDLEARGHIFSSHSDTEVILHLYEDFGPGCLNYLNGQFALAIWDSRNRSLFLARDRLGIRPLFYMLHKGQLLFGSELKTILSYPGVQAEIDPRALDQVFTYWSTLSPRTIFKRIFDLPPGHYMIARDGKMDIRPYWRLNFPIDPQPQFSFAEAMDQLESLLLDATLIRLRADVPVGAYLSGGLDSSTITSLIHKYTDNRLITFSIAFSDPQYDETQYQMKMAEFLGTNHRIVYARHTDIGEIFPQVIWHVETPILRTAPAPMFLLSKLVHQNNFKVVLTGEGADEFLGGYDLYKEAKIRRFWARVPNSKLRSQLFQQLYTDIAKMPSSSAYLASFFGEGLLDFDKEDYSHAIRWRTTSRTKRFFSSSIQDSLQRAKEIDEPVLDFPRDFLSWPILSRAQYLEAMIFLPQYLLSSQGDRVGMAHSVEGRFPFLDYRLVEFCNQLPPQWKIFGLREKYLLKKLARKWLPDEITQRLKRPYRAPIHRSFFHGEIQSAYVREQLSRDWIKAAGLFDPAKVEQLVQKIDSGRPLGETDDMALAGILSTQLVYDQFVQGFKKPRPVLEDELVIRVNRQTSDEP